MPSAAYRLERKQAQQVSPVGRLLERSRERRDEHLALPGGDNVRERRERFGVDEGHRAADDDQRVPRSAIGGAQRDARQPQQRQDVHVVPLEGHGEREDIELADTSLRFERQERGPRGQQLSELLFRRQEHALTDDVVARVEEPVHRLEAQVGHADPVRVGECQRHAQTVAVRLADVAGFFREGCQCAFALLPGLHC